MSLNRRLITDQDFQEAMDRQVKIRVFQNDHIVDSGGHIIRFDESTVVVQSGVSDLSYHQRNQCEFFDIRKR
jgi:ribosome maturation factor RimP